jgi:hypothetical protein
LNCQLSAAEVLKDRAAEEAEADILAVEAEESVLIAIIIKILNQRVNQKPTVGVKVAVVHKVTAAIPKNVSKSSLLGSHNCLFLNNGCSRY